MAIQFSNVLPAPTFQVPVEFGEINAAKIQSRMEEERAKAFERGYERTKKGAELTTLQNTMKRLPPGATEFDIDAVRSYAKTFGSVPINRQTGKIDMSEVGSTMQSMYALQQRMAMQQARLKGLSEQKTTKKVGDVLHNFVLLADPVSGTVAQEIDLGPVPSKGLAEAPEAIHKPLNALAGAKQTLSSLREKYAATKGMFDWVPENMRPLAQKLLGELRSYNPYDPKSAVYAGAIASSLTEFAKGLGLESGVLSDQDIARWKKSVPTLGTPEKIAEEMFNFMEQRINGKAASTLLNYKAQGYDVDPAAEQILGLSPEKWDEFQGIVKANKELPKDKRKELGTLVSELEKPIAPTPTPTAPPTATTAPAAPVAGARVTRTGEVVGPVVGLSQPTQVGAPMMSQAPPAATAGAFPWPIPPQQAPLPAGQAVSTAAAPIAQAAIAPLVSPINTLLRLGQATFAPQPTPIQQVPIQPAPPNVFPTPVELSVLAPNLPPEVNVSYPPIPLR